MERRDLEAAAANTRTAGALGDPAGDRDHRGGDLEPAEPAIRAGGSWHHPRRPCDRGRRLDVDRSLLPRPIWLGHPDRDRNIRPALAIVCLDHGPLPRREPGAVLVARPTAVHLRLCFALATLAYYAILVGLRPHHLIIWGAVFVAGLLPIWGGLGADRGSLAMIPLGLPRWFPGVLDQRVLASSFALSQRAARGHPCRRVANSSSTSRPRAGPAGDPDRAVLGRVWLTSCSCSARPGSPRATSPAT